MSEIDVSKCDRYNDFPVKRGVSQYAICLASFEQWGGADQKFCKDRPNCYYKQLQQLKQQLQLEKDNVAELNELLISYKEENEELKQENNELETRLDEGSLRITALAMQLTKIENILRMIYWDNPDINIIKVKDDILQIIEE